MAKKMTADELGELRASVRAMFIEGPMDTLVAEDIEYIRTNIKDYERGCAGFRRGIFVYGPSGTGKTTAYRHAIAKIPEFQSYQNEYGEWVHPSLYLKVPHKSSAADLVHALLRAMNLPTGSELRILQDELKKQLKERQIKLIHLDELQHTVRSNTAKAFEAIQDLLKELLDRDDWPLHMILSGMPRIHKMRQEDQIRRRTLVQPFHGMDFETDDSWIQTLLKEIAVDACGLTLDQELLETEFRERLCRSVNGAWGTMIGLIQSASFRALGRGRSVLTLTHFAREFERICGLPDDENMFLAVNFRDLDPAAAPEFGMED